MQTNNPVHSAFIPSHSLTQHEKHFFDLEKYPFIDIQACIKNMHVDHQAFLSILQTVIHQEFPNEKQAYLQAHQQGQWEKIEKLAHKMKGGAMYIGLGKLQHACQAFEDYYQTGQTELLDELYQQIMFVMQSTQKELEAILKRNKTRPFP